MPSYSATNVTQSIIDLLQGDMGTTAKVTAGLFKFGTFAGQPIQAEQAKAIQVATARHWFDVQLGKLESHESTPMSAQSNRRICKVPIRIGITTHCATTAQETQRKATRARIEQDAGTAIRALHYPDNLTTDDSGGATGIVSGLLLGPIGCPVWSMDAEEWDKHIIRSHIEAEAIVEVIQAEEPDTIYGTNLVSWHRSDYATVSQGVISALNDKTANANNLTATGSPVYASDGDELNYTPDVSLDGTDDHLSKATGYTLGAATAWSAWALVRVDTWTTGKRVFVMQDATASGAQAGQAVLNIATGADRWVFAIDVMTTLTSTTGANDGNYHLVYVAGDSVNDLIYLGIDGAAPASAAYTGAALNYIGIRIGCGASVATFTDETVKELLVLNAISTAAQDAKVLDYFRSRYGLNI